jgi:hypothetical protein
VNHFPQLGTRQAEARRSHRAPLEISRDPYGRFFGGDKWASLPRVYLASQAVEKTRKTHFFSKFLD